MDLMPTLARLAGIELPRDRVLDGHDVWPILAGDAGARSPRESFLYYDNGRLEGVRDGRWKLWFGREPERASMPGAFPPGGERGAQAAAPATVRLFDLYADVAETNNVAHEHPDIVARLQAIVATARADLGDDATGHQGSGARAPGVVADPRPLTEFVSVSVPGRAAIER
jgi:arylsulfatase A-like enzyme